MADSIEQRIIDTLQATLDGLKQDNQVRRVRYLADILVKAEQAPEIAFSLGPESRVAEDYCGVTLRVPLAVRIWLADYRTQERITTALRLKAAVIAALEADIQVDELAITLSYQGDEKFVHEVTQPAGGIYLFYDLQYRRKRADATSTY